MKINKTLVVISWLTLLPIIILFTASFITEVILIPNGICHSYNGVNFGDAAICSIFPAFSYFGFIFLLFGGLGFMKFVGEISVVVYFIKVFVHNKRRGVEKYKYSRAMFALVALYAVMQVMSVYAGHVTKSEMETRKQETIEKYTTPTETVFVCNDSLSLKLGRLIGESRVDLITLEETGGHSGSLIGYVDNNNMTFTWYSLYKMNENENIIGDCNNVNNKSISDLYEVTLPKEINTASKSETLFLCDGVEYNFQITHEGGYVTKYTGEEKKIVGLLDDSASTVAWNRNMPEDEKKIVPVCKNEYNLTILDLYEEVPWGQ